MEHFSSLLLEYRNLTAKSPENWLVKPESKVIVIAVLVSAAAVIVVGLIVLLFNIHHC